MWTELNRLNNEYKNLNLQDIIDYEKFCIISIVWHSTKIEGCSLTETDTKVLLENDITAGGKPLKDHLMIKDHFAAFQFIKEQAKQKRKLSVEFIQEYSLGAASSVSTALNSLIDKDLVVFDHSKYFLTDVFFSEWLKRNAM